MSLYFAANRWGNGTGIYNYKAQADRILSLMRHHPVQSGTPPFRLKPDRSPFVPPTRPGRPANTSAHTVGPMVNEEAKMILFVPGGDRNNFSDPSYHLPAFYELWSRWGPVEDRPFLGCRRNHQPCLLSESDEPNYRPCTGLCKF